MASTEISVVVPAYNEETLIQSTLDGLRAYLLTRPEPFEIVVVDDGSRDQTVALVNEWKKSNDTTLKLVANPANRGKGFSVRRGVQESCGRFIIFMDADLPYELGAIDDFLKALRNGHELAVGFACPAVFQCPRRFQYSISGGPDLFVAGTGGPGYRAGGYTVRLQGVQRRGCKGNFSPGDHRWFRIRCRDDLHRPQAATTASSRWRCR